MDSNDDDSQMPDAPHRPHISGGDWRPASSQMPSAALSGLGTANGLQAPQKSLNLTSHNGPENPTAKHPQDPSREPSVLANNVANKLSLEGSQDRFEERLENFIDELDDEEHEPTAPYVSCLRTGICYDVRMRYHCELDPPRDRSDYHPEDPRRTFKIYKELCIAGLVKDDVLNTGVLIPNPLLPISARDVTEAEVCLVHDKKHFDFMKSTSRTSDSYLPAIEKEE